jgi:hypothetical protein
MDVSSHTCTGYARRTHPRAGTVRKPMMTRSTHCSSVRNGKMEGNFSKERLVRTEGANSGHAGERLKLGRNARKQ